jgi:hypothetical protein
MVEAAESVVLRLWRFNRASPAGVEVPLQISKAMHERCKRFPQRILIWAVGYLRQVVMRGDLLFSIRPSQRIVRGGLDDEGY